MIVHEWNGLLPIVSVDKWTSMDWWVWFHDVSWNHAWPKDVNRANLTEQLLHVGNVDSYETSDVFGTTYRSSEGLA